MDGGAGTQGTLRSLRQARRRHYLREGDWVELGGLFGEGPVMKVSTAGNSAFVQRGGRIPAPLQSLTN